MDKKKLREIKPAGYPKSSLSEQRSVDIFHNLIDRRTVRGNASVMDKIPNTDGLMILIDDEQIPIGQFDLQLKTLPERFQDKPRFQCELALLSYALDSILPVILAVVDQNFKKIYWLHLNEKLIAEISPKQDAQSIVLDLNMSQLIDGVNLQYLDDWKKIIKHVHQKVTSYDQVEKQRDLFQRLLGGANPRLLPAYSINELGIRDIHIFLDLLNAMLDNEFKSIKEMLYYNYWKLAIAIIDYQIDSAGFFILPIPYSSNTPLILEVVDKKLAYSDELFSKDKAITMRMNFKENLIRKNPVLIAIELIDNEVYKVVGKKNFAIKNIALAEEYIYSFGNIFYSILGLKKKPVEIDLYHIAKTFFVLLPLSRDLEYGSSLGEIIHYIDHLITPKAEEHAKKINNAEKALATGMVANPKLKLEMQNMRFDLDLVNYYINSLQSLGITDVKNPFLEMRNEEGSGNFVWSYWNLPNMFQNLNKLFFELPSIYSQLVDEQFPRLKSELNLFAKDSLLVYVFVPYYNGGKPRLLYFTFLAIDSMPKNKILLFHADDADCPKLVGEDVYASIWEETFVLAGEAHKLRSSGEFPMEILFNDTPMHTLVNDILGKKLDFYFKSQGLKSTSYNAFRGNQ